MLYIESLVHIVTATLFILALRGLSSAATSSRGNQFGIIGMALAIFLYIYPWGFSCFGSDDFIRGLFIILMLVAIGGLIGYVIAKKINMTSLPQLLAAFHSLIGLVAVLIAGVSFTNMYYSTHNMTGLQMEFLQSTFSETSVITGEMPAIRLTETILGAVIGAITFTGSVVAFGKLQGIISGKPWRFKGQQQINFAMGMALIGLIIGAVINQTPELFISSILISFIVGWLLIMPIGGADMPVIISMLNSYSGWATAGIGFSMNSELLVIVGALVGTSGAILSHIMCKGMNRSLLNVIFGSFCAQSSGEAERHEDSHKDVKLCSPEDAGFILKNATSVIIVPGYGMAVAQAQHVIKELSDQLKFENIAVKYAIHPVAGRMPGHMNVLLAEANIPYEDVFELEDINHEFGTTDVAVVIGANDITNPAAKNDPSSPIYGMPVLDVEKARTVLFVKRSLGSGYAGIENQLFYRENTLMVLGDAKKVCENILKSIKN